MIPKKSIEQYLTAPRDDYSWLKNVPRQELLKALSEFDPVPNTDDLMEHQLAGVLAGILEPAFAYWWGMGVGKTLTMLRLFDFWYRAGIIDTALVLAPSQEAVYAWEDECRRWKVNVPVLTLAEDNSVNKASELLEFEQGIMLLSYPSLNSMVTRLEEGKKGKNKMMPRKSAIDWVCKNVGMVVYDESTEAKNIKSLTYRVCRALSMRINIRYALAGRPFGRDPTDLWGQHYLIDHGESLGNTLEIFRAGFFDAKKAYFGGPHSFNYKFRKEMIDTLHTFTQHRALRYSTEECVDLPPLSKIIKRFYLPAATIEYYRKIVTHLIAARGDKVVIQNDFMRLRQLSSGFIGVADDEFGVKIKVAFDNNPKLDLLLELLDEIPVGRKAVVFVEFIYSGNLISAALKKAKVKHVWLWSGTKDRRAAMQRFQDDPDCDVLLVQSQLGAFSLNLQVANYVFYYESMVSALDRHQSEARCWRKGQERKVFMYDLVAAGTADERILAFHKEGNNLFAALTRDPARWLMALPPAAPARKRPTQGARGASPALPAIPGRRAR